MWANAHMGLALAGEKRGPGCEACRVLLKKLVVDLTSSKGKEKTIEFEPIKPTTLNVATTIVERIS